MNKENVKFLISIIMELGLDLEECFIDNESEIFFGMDNRVSTGVYDYKINIDPPFILTLEKEGLSHRHYHLDLNNPKADPVKWILRMIREP